MTGGLTGRVGGGAVKRNVGTAITSTGVALATRSGNVSCRVLNTSRLINVTIAIAARNLPTCNSTTCVASLTGGTTTSTNVRCACHSACARLCPTCPVGPLGRPSDTSTKCAVFALHFTIPHRVGAESRIIRRVMRVTFPAKTATVAAIRAVLGTVTARRGTWPVAQLS